MPIATFVNMLTVLIGGTIGLWLGDRFPENIKKITFQAIGLFTFVLGIQMALSMVDGKISLGNNQLLVVFSLIIGGVIGELTKLETKTNHLGEWIKNRVKSRNDRFAEGLITTFLLFCIGAMTITGAINEGLGQGNDLLLTKSVLDGFTAIALATIYGKSVLFSVIPMLVFQGGITVLASQAKSFLTTEMQQNLVAVGGILILGIALNILEIKQIKVLNLLPALVMIILLTLFAPHLVELFSRINA